MGNTETKYTPLPGESYVEKLRARQEDTFTERAANHALTGKGWDVFLKAYPEYAHYKNREDLERNYTRMLRQANDDRLYDRKTFSVSGELEKVRNARRAELDRQIADLRYEKLRDDLLGRAYHRQPWEQVRREADGIGPDDKALYDRARKEVGTESMTDAVDPVDASFLEGFYS